MPLEEASTRGKQSRPKPYDGNGRGQTPQRGARGSDCMGDPLEEAPGIGQGAARMAQMIGIYGHDPF